MEPSYEGCLEVEYHKHAHTQAHIARDVGPIVTRAIEETEASNGIFTIIDFGCADGANSLELISNLIDTLKNKYGNKQAIHIIYDDLPNNNFNSLFNILQGDYLKTAREELFVSAVPISFYRQCVPSNTVNLAISTTAFHWLSQKPSILSDSILVHLSNVPEERNIWRTAAARDWEAILTNRAVELTTGGKAVFDLSGMVSIDERKQFAQIYRGMDSVYKQMIKEKIVTLGEYERTAVCAYQRTDEELRAPFLEGGVAEGAGLRLEQLMWTIRRCPLHERYMTEEREGRSQPMTYANNMTKSVRLWGEHTIKIGLNLERSVEEKEDILNEFFERFTKLVAVSPSDYAMDLMSATLLISKI